MFKALESTTVLNTTTLYTLIPLFTALLAIFFFKEKISKKQLIVYCIAMIGTSIVVFKADLELFLSFSLNSGDAIFLAGSVCMAFYSIFLKVLHKKDDAPLVFVFSSLLGGSIFMFLSMQVLGISLQWEKIKGELFYYVLYLALASTILTLFLYQKSAALLSSKKLMAYLYLSPALVAIMMYFYKDVSISFGVFVGILISFFATAVLLKDKE